MLENRHQKANRILKDIVKATLDGSYLYTSKDVSDILTKKGLVEVNEDIKNDAGECATRATEAGIAKVPKEMSVMNEYPIEDVPVKKAKRQSGKSSLYPFDALEVGQSFFVPASEEKAEPWKTMQSTVGTATRRYAKPVINEDGTPKMRLVKKGPNKGAEVAETENTRIFIINKDTKDGIDGARIGRIA